MGLKETAAHFIANQYAEAFEYTARIGSKVTSVLAPPDGGGADSQVQSAYNIINSITNEGETLPNAMRALGIGIALVFFLIAVLELAISERMNFEFFIRFFSKLALSIALVIASPQIKTAVLGFGRGFALLVSSGLSSEAAIGETSDSIREAIFTYLMSDEYEGHWIVDSMSALVTVAPIKIAGMILSTVAYIIAFSRMLELGIRGLFLPVAMGLLADDGWRGAGGRYIRKYLAVATQSAVLVAIAVLTLAVMSRLTAGTADAITGDAAMSKNLMDTILVQLGFAVASVMLMWKSIGITNDLFGA